MLFLSLHPTKEWMITDLTVLEERGGRGEKGRNELLSSTEEGKSGELIGGASKKRRTHDLVSLLAKGREGDRNWGRGGEEKRKKEKLPCSVLEQERK